MADLSLRKVKKIYDNTVVAVQAFDLEIADKEFIVLVGPSGCGKSTFLRTINRMNDLVEGTRVAGSLTFHGQEIYSAGQDVTALRRQIGMVFQKPNPFPMSVYDNIAYGPRTHGIRSKAMLDEIVERSLKGAAIWDEVKDRLKKSALGLSGGQQQRVAIARALATDAPVILADEPTGNLDADTAEEITAVLKESAHTFGKCVVVVTHSGEVAKQADMVLEIKRGHLKEREM